MKNKTLFIRLTPVHFLLLCLLFAFQLQAQKRHDISSRVSLSFELGNWQPHSLNDEPKFYTFGAAGATPSYRIGFTIPVGRSSGIELTTRYWALRDLEETENVHSLTLVPFAINLKHWLIPDYFLSAYVVYGGCLVRGFENQTDPLKLSTTARGWGINLGAGIDLTISKGVGAGLAFTYYLVRLNTPIGGVDDFSGPCISGRIYWLF